MQVINISDRYNGKYDWSLIIETENSTYEIVGFSYYKEILLEQDNIKTFGFDINNYDKCFISELN